MPHQVTPVFAAYAISYDVAIEDTTKPEITNIVLRRSRSEDMALSFGCEEQHGVELRTLAIKAVESVATSTEVRQYTISFAPGIREVVICERHFDSGCGKVLTEVAHLRIVLSDNSWLQFEPGWQVSDLVLLTRSA